MLWRINSIPELSDFPRERRPEIWRDVFIRVASRDRRLLLRVPAFLLAVAVGLILGAYLMGSLGAFIGALLFGVGAGILVKSAEISLLRCHLRSFVLRPEVRAYFLRSNDLD